MDINATLIGQMITFAVFVVFTMKFIWPPITKALADREKKIADGLAAAEKGEHSLVLAQNESVKILKEAKNTALGIVDQANSRAARILEEAKEQARVEGERLIAQAYVEIDQHTILAKRQLQQQVAGLAVQMAEKIVQHDIDSQVHQKLLDNMATEIAEAKA